MPNSSTPLWSSRPAFYLATVGAAVGLGSVWRLPYLVGSSGGSAFVFVFTIACLLIATPLLVAEFLIGRRSRLSPPDAAGAVAAQSGLSTRWNVIGILGAIAAFAIISSYTVVAGWVMAYTWKCASSQLAGLQHPQVAALWHSFLSDPLQVGAWHIAFLTLVGVISAAGVSRGIELATKIRGPLLLALLSLLAAYALSTGNASAGLRFAFLPNFAAITPKVVLAAVGQAFYATGVGMAMMLAYGAYVPKGASLVRSALFISGSILLVSLLATLTIFPLVFQYQMNPAQGPELVFDVLATVFAEMPLGTLFGTLFFFLLVLAALTPSIAGLEPLVAWLQQRHNFSRSRAVVLSIIATWFLGLGSVLSFSRSAGWQPPAWMPWFPEPSFFTKLDFVSSDILLPIGAWATSILIGWRISRKILQEELLETTPLARAACLWSLRYACPIGIAVVFLAALT